MDTSQIEHLHQKLLNSWNKRYAKRYASLFTENESIVGFDGSRMNSRYEIESEIDRIQTRRSRNKRLQKKLK